MVLSSNHTVWSHLSGSSSLPQEGQVAPTTSVLSDAFQEEKAMTTEVKHSQVHKIPDIQYMMLFGQWISFTDLLNHL